jgi:hypothetical protein
VALVEVILGDGLRVRGIEIGGLIEVVRWGRGMEAGARVEFAVDWRVCFSEQGVEIYIDEYPQEPIRQVR